METTKRQRKKLGEHFPFRSPRDISKLLGQEKSQTETIHKAVIATYAKIDTSKGGVRCAKCAGSGYAAEEELAASGIKSVRMNLELAKRLEAEENKSRFMAKSLYALYIKRRKIKGHQCEICLGSGKLFAQGAR